MGKYYFELLFRQKKTSEAKTEDIVNETFSPYLSDDDKTIEYIHGDKKYIYDYYFLQIQESLFVSISYPLEKKERISAVKINVFQKFIKEINIEASKKDLSSTILFENTSIYFIQKIIPYIHQYEWSLRKFIYLILTKDSENESIKKNIPKETIQNVKERKRGNVDFANILQELTLYNFENFLFQQNHIEVKFTSGEDTVMMLDKIDKETFIKTISGNNIKFISSPFSLWEEFFHPYFENVEIDNVEKDVGIDQIKEDMTLIRNGRNTVGHNKEVSESLFNNLKTLLEKYINIFNFVFKLILSGEIEEEELEITANEFESQFYEPASILNALSSLQPGYIDSLNNVDKSFNVIQGWDSERFDGILKRIDTSKAINVSQPLGSGYIDSLNNVDKSFNVIQGWDSERFDGILKRIDTSKAINVSQPLGSGYIDSLNNADKSFNVIQGWDSERFDGILKRIDTSKAINVSQPLGSGYIDSLNNADKSFNVIQGWDSERFDGILKRIDTSKAINVSQPLGSGYIDSLNNADKSFNVIQGWDSERIDGILKRIDTSNAIINIQPWGSNLNINQDKDKE